MLSIIIPTFNEKENVFTITKRIESVMNGIPFEIIFVDDSNDETPQNLEKLSKEKSFVRYEHRTNERGLGTAVVRGFDLAKGDTITVMDADLQHPPEMLLPMIAAINEGSDIVIPSRFILGGSDGGLNLFRKLVSATARYMGKAALSKLRNINDPTSGFFMFRKDVLKEVDLKPIGWKILIEILAKGKYSKVIEIPYSFEARSVGESKMSFKEQCNYIKHLYQLVRTSPDDQRFYRYSLVGLSGVLVNMLIYNFLIQMRVGVSLAGFCSALIAMIINFIFNDIFTWSDVKSQSAIIRLTKFVTTSLVGIGINVVVLSIMYHTLHTNYLLSNVIGILCGTVWNYTINNLWTWRKKTKGTRTHVIRWTPVKMKEISQPTTI